MYIVAKESILDVRMLDLTVGLHIIPTRELLPANGALMTLGSMDIGMMPSIRYDLVAAHTSI